LIPSENLDRTATASLLACCKTKILEEWERTSRQNVSAARTQSAPALRNSLPQFIDQMVKSLGCSDPHAESEGNANIAFEHGEERANLDTYTLSEVIDEYLLLRLVLIRRLEAKDSLNTESLEIIHRFIDYGIRNAAARYAEIEIDRQNEKNKELLSERKKLGTSEQKLEEEKLKLEQERDLREHFVATLTHDLRTPLVSAKLNAQILIRKAEDPLAVRRNGARIVISIDRTEKMIRDLLDANRIKAGEKIPISKQECRLDLLVIELEKELRETHGSRFRVENLAGEIAGYWDCSNLQRVVENLAQNAVKYGATSSLITIGLNTDQNWVDISVHNLGEPISASDQKTLFDPYRRLESAVSSGNRGWGLGLTLVKGIAEAHGGDVRIKSTLESGTTFYVRLPANRKES
jgi:signal transduction histidine kinase